MDRSEVARRLHSSHTTKHVPRNYLLLFVPFLIIRTPIREVGVASHKALTQLHFAPIAGSWRLFFAFLTASSVALLAPAGPSLYLPGGE